MDPHEITEELEHPGARNLLESATLLRLAYHGPDSFPRAIPIGFYRIQPHWARFFDFGAGLMPRFLQTLASDA
jgi:hypothetical protein